MPTKKLTELFAERVKPPASGRVEYFDATFGSLALRVTETGHKSWSFYYRMGGRLRRLTIGNYPGIKPAQARREAGAALERVRGASTPPRRSGSGASWRRRRPTRSRPRCRITSTECGGT
jgi:hypothetical protein